MNVLFCLDTKKYEAICDIPCHGERSRTMTGSVYSSTTLGMTLLFGYKKNEENDYSK